MVDTVRPYQLEVGGHWQAAAAPTRCSSAPNRQPTCGSRPRQTRRLQPHASRRCLRPTTSAEPAVNLLRELCRLLVSRDDHHGDRSMAQDLRGGRTEKDLSRLSGCAGSEQEHIPGLPGDVLDGLSPIVAAADHDIYVGNRDSIANLVELLDNIVHRPARPLLDDEVLR